MRNLSNDFKNRVVNYKKLIEYGFTKQDTCYTYKTMIFDNQFEIAISISEKIKNSKLIDVNSGEEYILVDIQDSTGEFVGNLRSEYEKKIKDIIEKCTVKNVFKNSQTKQVINYIKEKYGDELEFLWEKFDDNAIWRNKKNNKWYGLILTISNRKLGLESDIISEVIDLRYQKDEIENIINGTTVFPGYHMNKKSWITIILDNSVDTEVIYNLIDNSYLLSMGNNKRD